MNARENLCPVCGNPIVAGADSCASCGFRLHGATESFSPVDVPTEATKPGAGPAGKTVLHVVRGPQIGATYVLAEGEMSIGRSPSCTIFLNDMTVSRMHATIACEAGCFVISDANSFNGVWVNNVNVAEKTLCDGDFVQIGTFCLLFEENAG